MNDWNLINEALVTFFVMFFMMIGLIFSFLPPLPGTVIIWAAAVFYGLLLDWAKLGWFTFIVLTFLMVLGLVIDFLAGHFGARAGGASWSAIIVGAIWGLLLGLVASLIGTPILGCLAGVIGIVIGMLWIEWRNNRDWDRAIRATKGYMAGAAVGVVARGLSGIMMIGIFLIKVYFL